MGGVPADCVGVDVSVWYKYNLSCRPENGQLITKVPGYELPKKVIRLNGTKNLKHT